MQSPVKIVMQRGQNIDIFKFQSSIPIICACEEIRKGALETAEGGTVFLDEIAEPGPEAQALLLRTLDTGEIKPLHRKPTNPSSNNIGSPGIGFSRYPAPLTAWILAPRTKVHRHPAITCGFMSMLIGVGLV